jgi:cathepsin L
MSKFAVTLALLSSSLVLGGRVLSTDLKNYSFEKFVQDFRLKYSEDELPKRRAIFEAELKRVQTHNEKDTAWREGINKFSAMTKAEKQAFFGRSKGAAAVQNKLKSSAEHSLPADFKLREIDELPEYVDWRHEGVVSTVKDQGHCGSCWAFASTATMESHIAINSGLLFELSVQQVRLPSFCSVDSRFPNSFFF